MTTPVNPGTSSMTTSRAVPTVTVIGVLKDGTRLVRAEWSGQTTQLSERTLNAVSVLGVAVNDDKTKYLF